MSDTWKEVSEWLRRRAINPEYVRANHLPQTWRSGPDAVMQKLEAIEHDEPGKMLAWVRGSVGMRNYGIKDDGTCIPVLDTEVEAKMNAALVDRLYKSLRIVLGGTEAKKILEAAKGGK